LPSNVSTQDEASPIEVLAEGSVPPAPPSSRAKTLVAGDQREIPALTLRPPPEIAPPPVFASSTSLVPLSEIVSSGATETFRPSEVDKAVSLPPARGRSRWLPALAAITVLALGGGAWLKLRPHPQAQREARPAAVAARAAVPERAPAPPVAVEAAPAAPAPAPEPTPAPTPETSAAAPAPTADLTSAFAAALSGTAPSGNAVAVTVRVTPAGSIIFDHGRRIGTDVVQVNVEPGGRKNLVALLDGYQPRRFTVDSKLNSVSIALRPAGVPAPAEPATYGTPSTAAAVPSPAAAPPAAAATPPKAGAAVPKAPAAAKPGKKEAFDPSRDVGAL